MGQSALLGCLLGGAPQAVQAVDMIEYIKPERGKATLAYLCRIHPRMIGFDDLVYAGGLKNTGHANAALEYWLMRIEDDLPLVGWRLSRHRHAVGLMKM